MKLTYFLESDESQCCPPNVLKKGRRVYWQDKDASMFGRVVSVGGNSVTVTDEKFGTGEKHVVPRDKITKVSSVADHGVKGKASTETVWSKSKRAPEPEAEPVEEAKHTLIGNKLDFKHDEEVEQVVLTRLDSHDVAKLILKAAVMQAYVDAEHEAEKDKSYRDSADPEDIADEAEKQVDVKTVSEKAEEIAYSFADAVKEIVSGTRSDVYEGLIKHYFPDLT